MAARRAANGDAGRCLSVVTTTSDPADLLSNSKINAVELKAYRDGCTIIDGRNHMTYEVLQ
jgi:hypothetical protein